MRRELLAAQSCLGHVRFADTRGLLNACLRSDNFCFYNAPWNHSVGRAASSARAAL